MALFDAEKKEKLTAKFKELSELHTTLNSKKMFYEEKKKDALKKKSDYEKEMESFGVSPETIESDIDNRFKKIAKDFSDYKEKLNDSKEKFDTIEKTLRDDEVGE